MPQWVLPHITYLPKKMAANSNRKTIPAIYASIMVKRFLSTAFQFDLFRICAILSHSPFCFHARAITAHSEIKFPLIKWRLSYFVSRIFRQFYAGAFLVMTTVNSNMATPFVKKNFQSFSNCRILGSIRYLNHWAKHQSIPTGTGKKLPNVAFLLGFGLAGLVGFSGILYGRKRSRITAACNERESHEKENYSSPPASVSLRYEIQRSIQYTERYLWFSMSHI